MTLAIRVERVTQATEDVVSYLETDLLRNAFDIWNLRFDRERQELYVCRDGTSIKAHLSLFRAPEANYISIGALDREAITPLADYLPERGVVLMVPAAFELIRSKIHSTAVYPNDVMVIKREKRVSQGLTWRFGSRPVTPLTTLGSERVSTFLRSRSSGQRSA